MKMRRFFTTCLLMFAVAGGNSCLVWSGDQNKTPASSESKEGDELLFGQQTDLLTWTTKEGRVGRFAIIAVSNGRIACRLEDGRFAFTDVSNLNPESLEQLVALGMESNDSSDAAQSQKLDFGKTTEFCSWANTTGGNKLLAMCAADSRAAVFVDSNGNFYKCAWDSLATEKGKALLSQMLGPQTLQFVSLQEELLLVASLKRALGERKNEYIDLGKQYAGVTDETANTWFDGLVDGLSNSASGDLRWEVVISDAGQSTETETAFKKKLVDELLSTTQLEKTEFDAVVANLSVVSTVKAKESDDPNPEEVDGGKQPDNAKEASRTEVVEDVSGSVIVDSCPQDVYVHEGCDLSPFECKPVTRHRCRILARLRCR